ncbi:hypothetical protein BSU01_06710 [Erwinia billingiae]|jgi:hypothetical protein|uniref:hypothetical protein n=1 Tax=Erwinia billingiae TaxID=182337 RepID=UPI0019D13771|nr:hypothetical protein [Erwinia billingiae]MBN7121402.1 hypothetical protein [Erwinia billingiae]
MGDYYYLEQKARLDALKVVHRSGCLKLSILKRQREFLGTFYTSADALLTANKRYGCSRLCPLCCMKKG